VTRQRIAPQSGTAFELARGERLRVIDPVGQQVADCIAFALNDREEWLSSGRTFDYNGTIYLTAGHVLYSNRSNPMLTITADTVGRHDFLYTPCSSEMFSILYNTKGPHPSCFDNLCKNLKRFDIPPDRIPTTFNIFMNVGLTPDGTLSVMPPCSKAGDYLEMRAEVDLIIGLTACSAELSNNYEFKPIDFEIARSLDEQEP
jgi:uncharacterized protein YcgI (DUF1989 family)